MKVCSTCGESKPEDAFSWKVKDVRRTATCKDCHRKYRKKHYAANKQKYIDKAKRWKSENDPGGRYERHKVSAERFQELVDRFDGKCWVCKSRPATHIDHDHSCCNDTRSCGKCVRGVLCNSCNAGLGLLGDNEEGLLKALDYIRSGCG